MYKLIISISLVIVSLLTSLAFAIDGTISPSTLKVGILDIDQLMAKTKATDRAMKTIFKQYESRVKALNQEEKALQRTIKKYNTISDKLRPDEIKQWQHKINATQEQLAQKQAVLQEKIMSAEEFETQKIISRFFTHVTKVAEKNNLTLVFFKDVTAYNQPGDTVQDITSQIIKMSIGKKKA